MLVRALMIVLCSLSPASATGAPPQLSEERLAEWSDVIATGAVRRIYVSEEGAITRYRAEITVESCREGGLERGDVLTVRYEGRATAPYDAGSTGHAPRPVVGQRVEVFAIAARGAHNVVFPNGFREAEPLVFAREHTTEAYDALLEECAELDRYLLGIGFAERRLSIAWSESVARRLVNWSALNGEHEDALRALTRRFREDPACEQAMRSALTLAWDMRTHPDVFEALVRFARDAEHAELLGWLGVQAAWERDDDAYNLLRDAITIDETLGGRERSSFIYLPAIDAALGAGKTAEARAWLTTARRLWPDGETSWRRFDAEFPPE